MESSGKEDRYKIGGNDDDLGAGSSDEELERETEATTSTRTDDTPSSATSNSSEPSTNQFDQLPHRVLYDSPQEGRKKKGLFIDPDRDEPVLDEWQSLAKSEFSEKVHKSDVYLAGARAGFDNSDEEFLAKMREIGYGFRD